MASGVKRALALGGLAAAAAATALALAGTFGADDRPDPGAGRELAEQLCARCHATGPQGESPVASAPPFRALPGMYPLEDLAELLAEGMVVGHGPMPEFTFTPEQIDDLLAYLETL